jgi:hypothetical protein
VHGIIIGWYETRKSCAEATGEVESEGENYLCDTGYCCCRGAHCMSRTPTRSSRCRLWPFDITVNGAWRASPPPAYLSPVQRFVSQREKQQSPASSSASQLQLTAPIANGNRAQRLPRYSLHPKIPSDQGCLVTPHLHHALRIRSSANTRTSFR